MLTHAFGDTIHNILRLHAQGVGMKTTKNRVQPSMYAAKRFALQ